MNTLFLLMAEHEKATLPLTSVCEQYLHISERTAKNRAANGTLPFPAFRVGEGQKASWHVHLEDLAKMLDKQREDAKDNWVYREK